MYSPWSVVAFEQPTTAKWNQLGENDASFADGSGIGNDAIESRSIVSIDVDKISNPYAFSAYRNGAANSSSAWTKIPFNAKLFDTNNNFNTTTNQYTAPINGLYFFSAAAGNSTATGVQMGIAFYKNGSYTKAGGHIYPANSTNIICLAGLLALNAGDTVEVRFQGGNGSALHVGRESCYFEGACLAAT